VAIDSIESNRRHQNEIGVQNVDNYKSLSQRGQMVKKTTKDGVTTITYCKGKSVRSARPESRQGEAACVESSAQSVQGTSSRSSSKD
jgi:hypothetical protein